MKTHTAWLIFALIAVVYGAMVFSSAGTAPAAGTTPVNGDKISACIVAEKFVKQSLKAPATAEFPPGTSQCRTTQSGRKWTVTSYVDSQNGFGALIRTYYVVKMDYQPATDTYRLLDLGLTSS